MHVKWGLIRSLIRQPHAKEKGRLSLTARLFLVTEGNFVIGWLQ
mgnify:CR=1 FL=1|jgi:hypothetical protein